MVVLHLGAMRKAMHYVVSDGGSKTRDGDPGGTWYNQRRWLLFRERLDYFHYTLKAFDRYSKREFGDSIF